MHLDLIGGGVKGDLGHLRHHGVSVDAAGQPALPTFRCRRSPAGLFCHGFQHGSQPCTALVITQMVEAEGKRIDTGAVGQLVHKAFNGKDVRQQPQSTPPPGTHRQLDAMGDRLQVGNGIGDARATGCAKVSAHH